MFGTGPLHADLPAAVTTARQNDHPVRRVHRPEYSRDRARRLLGTTCSDDGYASHDGDRPLFGAPREETSPPRPSKASSLVSRSTRSSPGQTRPFVSRCARVRDKGAKPASTADSP